MASCVRNILAKNYQNLVVDFQVTIEDVGDVFLEHSVDKSEFSSSFDFSYGRSDTFGRLHPINRQSALLVIGSSLSSLV